MTNSTHWWPLTQRAGRDLEGLLALYADDAVHPSPKLRVQKPLRCARGGTTP